MYDNNSNNYFDNLISEASIILIGLFQVDNDAYPKERETGNSVLFDTQSFPFWSANVLSRRRWGISLKTQS